MNRRTFGRTGLEIPEVVFGGGWVGGVLIHQDDATKLAVLRRAIDAGIDWIDTAPSYGKGQSEQALGRLLKEVAPAARVSTKVMLDTGRLDDIAGQVERSIAESLRRLDRDSVELLQLHNPIGHACRQVIDSGRFDSAQVYYNLLNPSAGRAMPSAWQGQDFGNLIAGCKSRGMGIMVIRVFAAGVLASDARHGREVVITRDSELATEERRARAVFAALGSDHGTRAQTALRFVLSSSDISCAVIGLAEPAHLDEALAGAGRGPLPQAALDRLDQLYFDNFGL
jgi:D-threo-aldose 1-dehydrogenase